MSVKIRVMGPNNETVKGAQVFVDWGNTHSSGYTDDNGIFDLRCSAGTANSIRINGKEVAGKFRLEDKITEFSKP